MTDDWHQTLAHAVRDPDELIELLGLPDNFREPAHRTARLFPLMVPREYVARMEYGNTRDPLLLQVLPLGVEEHDVEGFDADAVGDGASRRAPGLLHKYAGRALLIATGACAIHCRYCFRRHYPYSDEPRRMADWEPAFEVLETDETIHEVILSGGDPLMLTDQRLSEIVSRLESIPHLTRLRIHSRLPIVLPERVTESLLDILLSNRLTPIMVVHANHPRELEGTCAAALRRLVRSGITVLNQAVLLRGVNDSADVLTDLSERLINLGVVPYYLHQLDRVSGTAHFEVSKETGRELIAKLRERLPGFAVPQYVQELPGELNKTPLT
ncbi:MAG: EF-P beta-lysylation protein EpmB [Planctomycetales bacterium]|nr:EF-P beta-lysylation protein EpmB [Planctomycetales bacterium]